jgi:hypothetical protein
MKFHPQDFRRINEANKPDFKIRTADETTLILIKNSGEAMYGRTRGDKDRLIKEFDDENDLLLFVWVGQHHTDIFLLTKKDVADHYS